MRFVILRLLLCLSFVFACKESEGIDMDTYICLVGIDNDPNVKYCSILYPELRKQVTVAHDLWLKRNKQKRRELESACSARLKRAYNNDQTRITQDKQKVRQIQEAMIGKWLKEADTDDSNCRSYIENVSKGNNKIDIQESNIKEMNENQVEIQNWPSEQD